MHASAITALLAGLSLSLGAVASPISKAETDVKLARRANSCTHLSYEIFAHKWEIYLDNDANYNKQCGGGCLDNIRGRCTTVTDWGCSRDDAGQAYMHFLTPAGCSDYDMTQALKACTKGEQTIDCSYAE